MTRSSEWFGPTAKLVMYIDRAIDVHRSKLTFWESDFLTSLSTIYRKYGTLSPKQKTIAIPILKRVGAMPGATGPAPVEEAQA